MEDGNGNLIGLVKGFIDFELPKLDHFVTIKPLASNLAVSGKLNVMIGTLLLGFMMFFSPTITRGQEKEKAKYFLEFEKIDNKVEVFLGDSLIYNSGLVRSNPKFIIQVNIYESLLQEIGKELTVRLTNGAPGVRDGDDIHWEVKYFLIKGDEEVLDFVWEEADDGKAGIVFEEKYTLE